mmetsp:Transcript_35523/g.40348  ORF Transcript_35523/g.40348 Transcript_35523/m.40348 type:complete len:120 (+) Transcript_35523:310-669(+)
MTYDNCPCLTCSGYCCDSMMTIFSDGDVYGGETYPHDDVHHFERKILKLRKENGDDDGGDGAHGGVIVWNGDDDDQMRMIDSDCGGSCGDEESDFYFYSPDDDLQGWDSCHHELHDGEN